MKKFFAILISLLCTLYLLNPSLGILEIIPDGFPIVGNLDEVAVFGILVKSLDILGISLPFLKLFQKEKMRDITPRKEED